MSPAAAPTPSGRAGAPTPPGTRAGASTPSDDRAGLVFGALSDPTRRALLAAVAQHPATTATELAAELPITRQAVIKHLGALTDAGLLQRTRSGREVHYQFTPAPLSDAVDWMAAVGAEWDGRLAVLRQQLGSEAGQRQRGGRPR